LYAGIRPHKMRILVNALVLFSAFVSASWTGGAQLPRSKTSLCRRAWPVAAVAKGEPAVSRAKELLDEAKNEEEQVFEEAEAAAAVRARSDEVIAQLKAEADAAVVALREADRPEVAAALESRGKAKPTGKLAKALRKPSGTMAVIGEGAQLNTISLGGFDLNDATYISEQYRAGGCSAVSVKVGWPGELEAGALAATTAEQALAKGNFPSPLPAVSRALFVDELQLAEAKADGAVGVVLPFALCGKEQTGALMACAAELGLEALVRVSDSAQLADALSLDAQMVVIGDCTLSEATELLAALPEGKAAPVTVADLAFLDVRGAWKLRDAGFNAMIAGRSMLDVCVRDRVPPTAICKAILSKGSVKYGLGMQKGRLEGSKECLGSIAM